MRHSVVDQSFSIGDESFESIYFAVKELRKDDCPEDKQKKLWKETVFWAALADQFIPSFQVIGETKVLKDLKKGK